MENFINYFPASRKNVLPVQTPINFKEHGHVRASQLEMAGNDTCAHVTYF